MKKQPVFLHNSLTGKKEKLEPIDGKTVRFYSCGPTVYNLLHIGNLRAAVVSDLIFRALKYLGYDVNYVRNYTDVDDKIIQRSIETGMSALDVSRKYIGECELDYAAVGCMEPTHKVKVSDHLPEIVTMIEQLVTAKHAYVDPPSGEVFVSVDSFPNYGCLSKRKVEDQLAGARVEVRQEKKNPADFTLWKPAKTSEAGSEVSWDSPWGKGRPGWHIECSAMSRKWLGDQMDIHHGGLDLVFPHHENEIAQSEGATHQSPYSKIWVHHAMLLMGSQKMSKSLGNVVLARDFLREYGGEVTRAFLLSVHHRTVAEWNDSTLDQVIQGLTRIYESKKKAQEIQKRKFGLSDLRAESMWSSWVITVEKAREKFIQELSQDLNVPGAMSVIYTLIREWNRVLAEPQAQASPGAYLGAGALLGMLEDDMGTALGIGRANPDAVLEKIQEIRKNQGKNSSEDALSVEEIQQKITERLEARKNKDFAKSDQIRDELLKKGITLKDGPQGTTWEYTG